MSALQSCRVKARDECLSHQQPSPQELKIAAHQWDLTCEH